MKWRGRLRLRILYFVLVRKNTIHFSDCLFCSCSRVYIFDGSRAMTEYRKEFTSFRAQERREITKIRKKKKSLRKLHDADQEGRKHKVPTGIG